VDEMEFETSETHPLVVDFVDEKIFNNSEVKGLGLCMIPGRNKKRHKRNLEKDLTLLVDMCGVDTLVTLVRQEELDSMGLNDYFSTVTEKFKLNSFHFPIKGQR
jgi:hypothetical protein